MFRFLATLSLFVVGVSTPCLAQNTAVLQFKNGDSREIEVTQIDAERIYWTLDGGAQTSTRYSDLEWIDFPIPQVWREAADAFRSGDLDDSIASLKVIANDTNSTFYPALGNFATLAQRRLIDCYRKQVEPKEIATVGSQIDWELLPEGDRDIEPLIAVWAAFGTGDHDATVRLATELESSREVGDRHALEARFLRGRALEAKGELEEAREAYAGVYTTWSGNNREITQAAVRSMIEMLEAEPEHEGEVHALVHLYTRVYGSGKVWDGASGLVQSLAEEELPEQ